MHLVVLANDDLKDELLNHGSVDGTTISWIETPGDFLNFAAADVYIDLVFQSDKQRMEILKSLSPKPIIVNSVIESLKTLEADFVRINGWSGFLKRPVVEASSDNNDMRVFTEQLFLGLNRTVEWIPDQPGFITGRVVSMIINEAYYALGEKISTKQEIDVAMKLGTNYPFGPFEWAERIGIEKIYGLLIALSKTNARYTPAPELKQEVKA